jgi:hypothetical protein
MNYHTAALKLYLSQRGFHFTEKQIGEPIGPYSDFDDCVAKNSDKDDPYAYCGFIKSKIEMEKEGGGENRKISSSAVLAEASRIKPSLTEGNSSLPRIFETPEQIQEVTSAKSFSWYPDLSKLKHIAKQSGMGGKFLLVEGLHPMITDPFNQGHGPREWTEEQLKKSAYTAIGKTLNINHEIPLNAAYRHLIVDGEYNEQTRTAEYIVYEEDPEILELIRQGYITAVSMQGYPRRESQVCDSCGSIVCACRAVPEGVIFGEGDGAAMAYVVTKEGARYMGKPVEPERPGDWNTSVQVVETNLPVTGGRDSSLLLKSVNTGDMSQSQSQSQPIPRQVLARGTKPQLQERILYAEKYLVREDLQTFNDALASGDAVKALSVIANDLYRSLQDDKSSFPDPKQQPQVQTDPFSNTDDTEGSSGSGSFGSSAGANAGGFMPQQPPSDVPRGQPPAASGKQPQQYSVPAVKSPSSNKNKKMAKEDEVDYATDQGNPQSRPGIPKKQTVPDMGIDDDNSTLTLKPTEGDGGSDAKPAAQAKQGQARQGGSGSKADEDGEQQEDEIEELRKEVNGLKQSFKNLSEQVLEFTKTRAKLQPTYRNLTSQPRINETVSTAYGTEPQSEAKYTKKDIEMLRAKLMLVPLPE